MAEIKGKTIIEDAIRIASQKTGKKPEEIVAEIRKHDESLIDTGVPDAQQNLKDTAMITKQAIKDISEPKRKK